MNTEFSLLVCTINPVVTTRVAETLVAKVLYVVGALPPTNECGFDGQGC